MLLPTIRLSGRDLVGRSPDLVERTVATATSLICNESVRPRHLTQRSPHLPFLIRRDIYRMHAESIEVQIRGIERCPRRALMGKHCENYEMNVNVKGHLPREQCGLSRRPLTRGTLVAVASILRTGPRGCVRPSGTRLSSEQNTVNSRINTWIQADVPLHSISGSYGTSEPPSYRFVTKTAHLRVLHGDAEAP